MTTTFSLFTSTKGSFVAHNFIMEVLTFQFTFEQEKVRGNLKRKNRKLSEFSCR